VAIGMTLGKERRRVLENLRRIHGRRGMFEEGRDLARTFAAYGSCLAESLGAERLGDGEPAVALVGEEHLRRGLASPNGLVIATAHIGPWDVAARLLRKASGGRALLVVMRAEDDARARALHDAVRERAGARVLHVGHHPMDALPLLRHLREHGIVAMQLDRGAPGARELVVDLFGKPFALPEGPFRVAALARAPLVPLFTRRIGYFEYEVEAGEPIELPPRPGESELREASALAAGAMERFIRKHPTQWFHFGT
jgi:KDO2-lipid IV(A) lauroyltransferase